LPAIGYVMKTIVVVNYTNILVNTHLVLRLDNYSRLHCMTEAIVSTFLSKTNLHILQQKSVVRRQIPSIERSASLCQ